MRNIQIGGGLIKQLDNVGIARAGSEVLVELVCDRQSAFSSESIEGRFMSCVELLAKVRIRMPGINHERDTLGDDGRVVGLDIESANCGYGRCAKISGIANQFGDHSG